MERSSTERSNMCYGEGMRTELLYDESTGDITATMNGASWIIHVDWIVRDGALIPRAVSITMDDDDSELPQAQINATTIRQLAIGEAIKLAREERAIRTSTDQQYWELLDQRDRIENAFITGDGSSQLAEMLAHVDDELDRLSEVRKTPVGPRRGSPVPDAVLEEVAQVYRRASERGSPVTDAIAGHFHIAKSTAGKRIMKARQHGYLPPRRGKQ